MKRVATIRHGRRTIERAALAAALAIGLGVPGPVAAQNAAAQNPPPAEKPAPAGKPSPKHAPGQAEHAPGAGPHWGYEGAEGPEHWGDLDPAYATCKTGKLQSPIDLSTAKLVVADLDSIRFYYKPAPLDVSDTGHSIQVNFEPGSAIKVDGVTYSLMQVHFHRPSEEKINGKSFPMVAHMVHKSPDGRLAVIAVLLTVGKVNPLVDAVVSNLPKDAGGEAKAAKTLVDPAALLPPVRNYYAFQGSLTTPPCTEGVSWFVLKSQTSISAAQEQALAKRYAHNARPIQPTGARKVQASE